jgi:hypothetical protein
LVTDGKFQKFDFGKTKNLEKYGSERPPEIDVSKISKIPIAMFAGNKDELADVTDT